MKKALFLFPLILSATFLCLIFTKKVQAQGCSRVDYDPSTAYRIPLGQDCEAGDCFHQSIREKNKQVRVCWKPREKTETGEPITTECPPGCQEINGRCYRLEGRSWKDCEVTLVKPELKITGATKPEFCNGEESGVIKTAIGCIPTKPQDLIRILLNWGISLAGGIAFLRMIWAAFQYITSVGNPEKVQEAGQTLSSSIAGLLLIIFSVFLLRLIGITVLKIF